MLNNHISIPNNQRKKEPLPYCFEPFRILLILSIKPCVINDELFSYINYSVDIYLYLHIVLLLWVDLFASSFLSFRIYSRSLLIGAIFSQDMFILMLLFGFSFFWRIVLNRKYLSSAFSLLCDYLWDFLRCANLTLLILGLMSDMVFIF